MNTFCAKLKENKMIIIVLVTLFIVCSVCALINYLCIGDFWTSLSAGLVGTLLTITIIDYLQEQGRKLKFKNSEKIINRELKDLSILTINWIASRFGFVLKNYYKDDADKAIHQVCKNFKKLDINKIIQKFSLQDWNILLKYLVYIKSSIDESVSIYKDHISGDLLGLLFRLRSNFKGMYWTFGLMHAGWIVDNKTPPQDLVNQYIKELQEVIESANNLLKVTKS